MSIEVTFQPLGRRVEVSPGVTIMEAARSAGLGLTALCGGNGNCGKCLVVVPDSSAVAPIETAEADIIDGDLLSKGYRLACFAKIEKSLHLTIPAELLGLRQRIQVEGVDLDLEIDPPVRGLQVRLPAPSVEDLRADWERLSDVVAESSQVMVAKPALAAAARLPLVLRDNDWQAKVAVRNSREVVAVHAPDVPLLGLAVDLGTTKIAAHLIDLESGRSLAMAGAMNPQLTYGEDVISRVSHVMTHETGADDLQAVVVAELNRLVVNLCRQAAGSDRQADFNPHQIVDAVIAGNTAMHHMLLKLPVKQLGLAPYVASVNSAMDIRADEIGLGIAKGAYVHFFPNIAGFVGGDHVAMLMAADIPARNGVCIAMDIGTNTEVSLCANGRLACCSTASGPAFEGAHISDGIRALPGAIERVWISSTQVQVGTIDGQKPVGICGSGILEALAQLRQADLLDIDGGLLPGSPMIRKGAKGMEMLLAPAEQSGNGRDIVITRKDISEIQMAKAAIRTGVDFLLQETGHKASEIDAFIVAGAFGTYLQIPDAIEIGMFPKLPLDRFQQVGNAAGVGAKMALLSETKRNQAVDLAERIKYYELTNAPKFQELFLASLDLA